MLTISRHRDKSPVVNRQALHALGVLIPIQFHPVKIFPGRHPLGRAGDGMRLLRTRPYVAGEDNPRDIDKFSPANDRQVMEWEDEAQASIMLLADISASMKPRLKSTLRNACLLQLTYSLWRAGDRVSASLFDDAIKDHIRAANLRTQMEKTAAALIQPHAATNTDVSAVLRRYIEQARHHHADLVFVVSDFVTSSGRNLDPDTEWRPILNVMRRNVVPVVISFEIPNAMSGVMKLWDPERKSRRLTWFSANRIRRINQEEKDRVASLVSKFRSVGLDYMIVSNQRQIYPQLARLARVRRLRKH